MSYFASNKNRDLLFGKLNFMVLIAGFVVVILGFLLMAGGTQPDPNTWQPEEIYSTRRITLAPFVVIAGLCIIAVSIFLPKKGKTGDDTTQA